MANAVGEAQRARARLGDNRTPADLPRPRARQQGYGMDGRVPTTVTRSRWPLALTLSTPNSLSSLKKVVALSSVRPVMRWTLIPSVALFAAKNVQKMAAKVSNHCEDQRLMFRLYVYC